MPKIYVGTNEQEVEAIDLAAQEDLPGDFAKIRDALSPLGIFLASPEDIAEVDEKDRDVMLQVTWCGRTETFFWFQWAKDAKR